MKNVTITLDEKVARWAKVWAARHDTSVSRMLGEQLQRMMESESVYERARLGFLQQKPVRLKSEGGRYASRESLYGRQELR
jgi:plasmid stability protein